MKKSYVIIGLGRFGTAVATELSSLGNEVLAVDIDRAKVQAIADQVTQAVAADGRDPSVLRSLGVRNFDCAVVTVGDLGSSVLVTLSLKEMGIPKVVCKAQSDVHRRVLEKIGADRVVFPEHEMGVKLAQTLAHSNVLNFIELSDDVGIVETTIPKEWQGKNLMELDVRARYKVNIIAVRKKGEEAFNVTPGPSTIMETGDAVVALGRTEDVNRLQDL